MERGKRSFGTVEQFTKVFRNRNWEGTGDKSDPVKLPNGAFYRIQARFHHPGGLFPAPYFFEQRLP